MIEVFRYADQWLVSLPDDDVVREEFVRVVRRAHWDDVLRLWSVPMVETAHLFRVKRKIDGDTSFKSPVALESPFVKYNRLRGQYEIRVRNNRVLRAMFESTESFVYNEKKECWTCHRTHLKVLEKKLAVINRLGGMTE